MQVVTPALRTADGERLATVLLAGPGDTCVVLAHGFSGSTATPALRRVAEGLARHASVLAYDARGHGSSTGRTTLGDREVLDVVARVAPLPLLVVHGDRDGYFAVSHAQALAAAAGEPVELWIEPGFAHAESGAGPALVDRLGARLVELSRVRSPSRA